jgi:hypothetical protein
MPTDHALGNGAGAFMQWGQVRGKNGVIIAAPTAHPDDGYYHWTKTSDIGALPDSLRECLSEAAESTEPLTDTELEAFLDTYQGGGCGRDDCRHSVNGPAKQFQEYVADGASRHDTMVRVAPWALSEAMAGCYSAREAFGTLYSAYAAAFNGSNDRVRIRQLGDEYMRIMKWAAAQANPDRAHRNDPEPTTSMESSSFRGNIFHPSTSRSDRSCASNPKSAAMKRSGQAMEMGTPPALSKPSFGRGALAHNLVKISALAA